MKENIIMIKYKNYNQNINDEHIDFILLKEKYFRCFCLNEIYQNSIQNIILII